MMIRLKPIASGTAKTTETNHINTISTAVHFGTPIPLIRLQEATARYLKRKIKWSSWQAGRAFFFLKIKWHRLFLSNEARRGINRSQGVLGSKRSSYLSILSAQRLSTVIPTEAFWMKGTSLHIPAPKGQSSASSCVKEVNSVSEVSGGTPERPYTSGEKTSNMRRKITYFNFDSFLSGLLWKVPVFNADNIRVYWEWLYWEWWKGSQLMRMCHVYIVALR